MSSPRDQIESSFIWKLVVVAASCKVVPLPKESLFTTRFCGVVTHSYSSRYWLTIKYPARYRTRDRGPPKHLATQRSPRGYIFDSGPAVLGTSFLSEPPSSCSSGGRWLSFMSLELTHLNWTPS